ncbi:MAG: ribonuclease HII [Acidobacteria bacterium]|nr:ribonuclease HII [Candidatus Sulfomarinibacter kjeldsenii]MBD3856630.1 ribonuclease HII [Candidatus Sulfomarinibacter kjeldsenii]
MTTGVDVLGSKDRDLLLGANAIIGVDEVGRGALAGPVVVCAAAFEEIPDDGEVRDSKLLSPRRRDSIAARLRNGGARWVVCEVWPELIDRINILEATRLAMAAAARTLIAPRSVVITDYVNPGDLGCRILSPKRADRDYFCVAAASIVAKVHRDRIMVDLGRQDPRWKWERNKGYGTVDHRRALQNVGPGILHRRSFGWSPVLP